MGLDLRLLPFDADMGNITFSHTVLSCERRRDLFDNLLKLPEKPVPDEFYTFVSRDGECEEMHYGTTQTTPYGETLTYVLSADLLAFSAHSDVLDNAQNRAIWAYLKELPPQTKVALYWH